MCDLLGKMSLSPVPGEEQGVALRDLSADQGLVLCDQ